MEDSVRNEVFTSTLFFRPAVIYPGNDNTPNGFGWLNEKLNWLLPGVYNTVGSEEIAQAMVNQMAQQLAGDVVGVKAVDGGADIRKEAQK